MEYSTTRISEIASRFALDGAFVDAARCGTGHINDTFRVECRGEEGKRLYTLQHINRNVFKDPAALMENVVLVTSHQRRILEQRGVPDVDRRTLTVVHTHDRSPCHVDQDGEMWRCYVFIDDVNIYDAVEEPRHAFGAARMFGEFLRNVADLPPGSLRETIPGFHNTPKRMRDLLGVIESDLVNRASGAGREIEFALARQPMTSLLVDGHEAGKLPGRVTHNDTKLNNVLFDAGTGEGICIIDLDTIMPGLALYDFGDMVRSSTSTALENERDLSKVYMQMPMFEALVRGYLESAGDVLVEEEKRLLAFSGKLITFEIGIRFLADHLAGDTYFRVHREGENLDRCRNQFKLVESIEEQEEAMNKLVESFC